MNLHEFHFISLIYFCLANGSAGVPDNCTTAVDATLWKTEPEANCQVDRTVLLQAGAQEMRAGVSRDNSDGSIGHMGPMHHKDAVITAMNDLAQCVGLSSRIKGTECDHLPGRAGVWRGWNLHHPPGGTGWWCLVRCATAWVQDFGAFAMFCAENSCVFPWPREEWQIKKFQVFLENKDGKKLGVVVAAHDPDLLGETNGVCPRRFLQSSAESQEDDVTWPAGLDWSTAEKRGIYISPIWNDAATRRRRAWRCKAVQRPFQAICRMDGVVFHAWSGSSSSCIPLQALMWLLKTFWHPIWMRAGFISSFFTKTTLLVRGTYSKMAGKKSGCG